MLSYSKWFESVDCDSNFGEIISPGRRKKHFVLDICSFLRLDSQFFLGITDPRIWDVVVHTWKSLKNKQRSNHSTVPDVQSKWEKHIFTSTFLSLYEFSMMILQRILAGPEEKSCSTLLGASRYARTGAATGEVSSWFAKAKMSSRWMLLWPRHWRLPSDRISSADHYRQILIDSGS